MNFSVLPALTDAQAQEFAKHAYAMLKDAYAMFKDTATVQEETLALTRAACEEIVLLRDERDALAAELAAFKLASA